MNPRLAGKKILLGITGAGEANRACELIRLLHLEGADIQAVLTQNGARFVSTVTLKMLTGKEAPVSMWQGDSFISHVSLNEGKDLVLIAPATANIIAKAAHGICDDLLSTIIVSRTAPLMIAPSMHFLMWRNVATRENVEKLKSWGVIFCEPGSWDLANKEETKGRFMEPSEIVEEIVRLFSSREQTGMKV